MDTAAEGGVYDISNMDRLGKSEVYDNNVYTSVVWICGHGSALGVTGGAGTGGC